MKKIALITGSSSGIGREVAVQLAKDGFISVVNYRNNLHGAEQTLQLIERAGGEGYIIQGDVTSEADVKNMVSKIVERSGKIDVLVNNAGVCNFAPLEGITRQSFDDHFNTNVWSAILTIRESAPYMERGGSVINISSKVSKNPSPHSLLYAASKGALDIIATTLAKEFGARGIRFNTIAPGGVDTEGNRKAGIFPDNEIGRQVIAETPLNRFGQPEDIAKVISFLASDEAGWITGERITVSGGLL